MTFIHDTLIVFRRQMRLSLRNPAWVIIALVQPILYLALFGPLLTKVPLNGSTSAGGHRGGVQVLRAWPADPARPVRLDVRRVRDHLGLAGRGHRAVPRDAGEPARDHDGPGAAGRGHARGPGRDPGARRPWRSGCARRSPPYSSALASSWWSRSASRRCRTRPRCCVKSEDAFAPHAQLGRAAAGAAVRDHAAADARAGLAAGHRADQPVPVHHRRHARGLLRAVRHHDHAGGRRWSRWAWRRCACGWGRASSSARTLRPGRPPGGQAPGPRRR